MPDTIKIMDPKDDETKEITPTVISQAAEDAAGVQETAQ